MFTKNRPKDNILDFQSDVSVVTKQSHDTKFFENAVQFESLPLQGWQDGNSLLDSKCRQSCFKDCCCVSHCSLILA